MHVDDELLAPVRARYGEPAGLEFDLEISRCEHDVVSRSTRKNRFHDVTFFVFADERLALIRKPHYTPGLWRPPGGGLKPGEPFEAGVEREALEELGVQIALTRYLVATRGVFRYVTPFGPSAHDRGPQPARSAVAQPRTVTIPWATHVFAATTEAAKLTPIDTNEISAARWGTLDQLQGPIRERLLATGAAFWRYRVALHDAAASVLG